MNKEEKFSFGKFQGHKLIDVWTGDRLKGENDVLLNYIQEVSDFIVGSKLTFKKILSPYLNYNLIEKDLAIFLDKSLVKSPTKAFDIIKSIAENHVPYMSVELIDGIIHIDISDQELLNPIQRNAFSRIISKILSGSFNSDSTSYLHTPYIQDDTLNFYVSEASSLLWKYQAQPSYIIWCIKNVPGFCLSPEDLSYLKQQKSIMLTSFKVSIIHKTVIRCTPVFKSYQFKVTSIVEELNKSKYYSLVQKDEIEAKPTIDLINPHYL